MHSPVLNTMKKENFIFRRTHYALIFLFVGILGYLLSFPMLIGIAILTVNVLTIVRCKANWGFLILNSCIAYSNYSIIYANYVVRVDDMFVRWADHQRAYLGLLILLVLGLFLFVFTPEYKKKAEKQSLIEYNQSNLIIFWGICFVLVVILLFGITRPQEEGVRGEITTFFEYSLILFIIGFYYAGKKKWRIILLTLLLGAFVLQDFVLGGRITGLQLMIAWILCVFIDKIKLSYAVILGILGLILLTAIGQFRAALNLDFATLIKVVSDLLYSGVAMDTAYAAYWCSLTFLWAGETIPLANRVYLFGQYVSSLILGGSVPNSNLADHTRPFVAHYGGGVLPLYAFFYLGWIGVFIIGWVLSRWLRTMEKSVGKKGTGLEKCLSIYIVASTFRWYLYSPSNLLRGASIFALCYAACYVFHIVSKIILPKLN